MRSRYSEAPIDQVFGYWQVMGYSHYDNEHHWRVKCLGCEREMTRRAGQLVNGRSTRCQRCNSYEREKYSFWEGIDGISKQYLTKLGYRGKEVSVTLQDLVDQWHKQKGVCAYTGLQLTLVSKDSKWAESTASIDRIDSSVGYVLGNIQWVHKKVNTMKSDFPEHEFIGLCRQIARYHGGSCGV